MNLAGSTFSRITPVHPRLTSLHEILREKRVDDALNYRTGNRIEPCHTSPLPFPPHPSPSLLPSRTTLIPIASTLTRKFLYSRGPINGCCQHHSVSDRTRNGHRRCLTALFDSCGQTTVCLLYTSPSPRDCIVSRMPSSA